MAELISKEKVLWCLKASSEEIDWGQSEDGDAFKHYIGAVYRTIAIIKPEQPEQKHGHWKTVSDYYDDEHWQCSACGCEWYLEAGSPTENNMHYCPECGAKMDEEVKQDARP